MTIRSFGRISLTDIQNEFGGTEPISISEYYRGGAYTTTNNSKIAVSGLISGASFYGASKYAPGWHIFYYSDTIFLPPTSGTTLYFYVIGGGGGGGGGSSRITYGYGAGGGGGTGGNIYGSFTVTPGDIIATTVGGGGTAGGARDGPYSGGSSGGAGGYSQIRKNNIAMATGYGGIGGTVAQYGMEANPYFDPELMYTYADIISNNVTSGGAVGSIVGSGSYMQAGDTGQYGQNGAWWAVGGYGGRGFYPYIAANSGTFSRGSYGSGGIGYYNGYGSARNATSGTGYGAGGSGGGAMLNENASSFNGSSGNQGIVLIWW